jgi:uncharacterized phage-like protein YoqJ
MALGVDQDFVDVCIELEIPFVAVVPFEGQESQWPWESREYYHAQLKKASEVVYVSPPGYASWKMHRRNEWQVDEIGPDGIVLAVWDGSSGGTANCVAYARSRNRKIEIIDPDSLDLDHVVL